MTLISRLENVRRDIAEIPQLKRGIVWCTQCGHSTRIDAAEAMRNGWPRHCGFTMSLDSPEERRASDQRIRQHEAQLLKEERSQ